MRLTFHSLCIYSYLLGLRDVFVQFGRCKELPLAVSDSTWDLACKPQNMISMYHFLPLQVGGHLAMS